MRCPPRTPCLRAHPLSFEMPPSPKPESVCCAEWQSLPQEAKAVLRRQARLSLDSPTGVGGPIPCFPVISTLLDGHLVEMQAAIDDCCGGEEGGAGGRAQLRALAWLVAAAMGQREPWEAETARKIGMRLEKRLRTVRTALQQSEGDGAATRTVMGKPCPTSLPELVREAPAPVPAPALAPAPAPAPAPATRSGSQHGGQPRLPASLVALLGPQATQQVYKYYHTVPTKVPWREDSGQQDHKFYEALIMAPAGHALVHALIQMGIRLDKQDELNREAQELDRLLEEAKREMGQLAERRTMEEDYEQRLAALTRALAQKMARADRLQSLADQSLEVSRTVVGIAQTGTYDEEED